MATIMYTDIKDVPKNKQVIPYRKYLMISIGINLSQLAILGLKMAGYF